MRSTLHPKRFGAAFPAIVFAGIICFADRAEAMDSRQLQETQVVRQIQSYCATCWRNAKIPRADWSDCSQQVFAELLERVPRQQLASAIAASESRQRRELNRSIWRIAKRWLRAARHRSLNGYDTPDPSSIVVRSSEDETFESVRQFAAEQLSSRQSRVFALLCDGHSVHEISQLLALSAARVSDEKYRAIQKIRRHLAVS